VFTKLGEVVKELDGNSDGPMASFATDPFGSILQPYIHSSNRTCRFVKKHMYLSAKMRKTD
jgi:hypothetical protein